MLTAIACVGVVLASAGTVLLPFWLVYREIQADLRRHL